MTTSSDLELPPLSRGQLVAAGLLLASANFIAVLDTTIANVSVPTIAGGLGASTSQGTYVITSYAVAEAITVPLTGWLANRFGAVRVFVLSMLFFGIFSALCGLSTSLGMLSLFRVFQGLAGGPLMPLSQTLLLRIFPKEKASQATGLWAMTTLIAPVLGPILGGVICDNASWPYIFYINVPVALVCAYAGWQMLKRFETPLAKLRIDVPGLIFMVIWVAALQLMLDEGKDLDWFASKEIVTLAIVAVVGFAAFMIWEMTERDPVVNLRIFRHRGFAVSVLTISLGFGAFFGVTVLTPLWLQGVMGYTASWAGYTTAWSGVFAVVCAPLAASLSSRVDLRWLVFLGVTSMGLVTLMRAIGNTDMTYWQIAMPLLLQGIGMPFFFVPLTGLALASVDESEMASAAGLMNFLRTLSGAIATSLVTTVWENKTHAQHAELTGLLSPDSLLAVGGPHSALSSARGLLDNLVEGQSVMLSTNQTMALVGGIFLLAACAIWLAPKPSRIVDAGAAGGH